MGDGEREEIYKIEDSRDAGWIRPDGKKGRGGGGDDGGENE